MPAPKRVAIIGGGISGLSAAWELAKRPAEFAPTIFESSPRVGGTLQTIRHDQFLIELSADMFITDEPDAIELCRELGIEDRLISTDNKHRRAFVCRNGKLIPIPRGFAMLSPRSIDGIWNSRLLDIAGKLRLIGEQHVPPRLDNADESLEEFAKRRFGDRAFAGLIQPLIGGIYTADPKRLSMQATLQRFIDQEQKFGSLIAAARQTPDTPAMANQGVGARYGKFVAPENGMQELVDALERQLPANAIRVNSPVKQLARAENGDWNITLESGTETFDAVIIAISSHAASKLLNSFDHELAESLGRIPYASSAVVVHGFRRSAVGHPLDGFGFVVPQIEYRRMMACSFSSVKFAGRAPDDLVLIRTFVGGALQPELLDQGDDQIDELVQEELREILSTTSTPIFSKVVRWTNAMPQYHLGHLDLVTDIESRVDGIRNLALAGNALHGVGIPACIRSGKAAANCVARK